MPEVPNAADFQNSSLATSTKLQSCSDLEKAQHGLYQAAHLFYAASLLIPHHTFVWSIFISRILMGLAYALVTVWACLELCAPDVFAWNVLLTAGTLVHIVYWSWRFRPGRIRQKPLLELYQKLFLPLDCSRELFVQLTNKSVIRSLQVGDDFFLATRQLCSIPASSNPSASMRLSILLTGKWVYGKVLFFFSPVGKFVSMATLKRRPRCSPHPTSDRLKWMCLNQPRNVLYVVGGISRDVLYKSFGALWDKEERVAWGMNSECSNAIISGRNWRGWAANNIPAE